MYMCIYIYIYIYISYSMRVVCICIHLCLYICVYCCFTLFSPSSAQVRARVSKRALRSEAFSVAASATWPSSIYYTGII